MMRRLVSLAAAALLVGACGSTTVVYVTPAPTAAVGAVQVSTQTAAPAASPASSQGSGTGTGSAGGGSSASGLPRAIAATVRIYMYQNATDDQPYASGSGTIISPDGYILTNSHVASPSAPGLAVQYGDPNMGKVGKLVILMTQTEDAAPVPKFQASLVAVDGYLDVAVIKIDKTADGQPVDGSTLNLPNVKVGDSDAMHIGDRVTIVGFPGIGGDTVTEDTGDVSGFISDDRIGDRAWIKTSAIVYHGNSGGLAENAAGELIAIPTRLPDFGVAGAPGGFSLLRPSKLALPVIQAATSGQQYGDSKYVVPSTGQEQAAVAGWLDPSDTGCSSPDPQLVLPVGVQRLAAAVSWSGIAPNEDVMFIWVADTGSGAKPLYKDTLRWTAGSSGACYPESLSTADGFPEGKYTLGVFAGPNLEQIAQASITVAGQTAQGGNGGTGGTGTGGTGTGGTGGTGGTTAQGVVLTGRLVNTSTGRPIAGGLFVALLPGTDIAAWLKNPADAQAAAWGKTGADGVFTANGPLEIGQTYPIVIAAKGYKALTGNFAVDANTASDQGDIGLAPTG